MTLGDSLNLQLRIVEAPHLCGKGAMDLREMDKVEWNKVPRSLEYYLRKISRGSAGGAVTAAQRRRDGTAATPQRHDAKKRGRRGKKTV